MMIKNVTENLDTNSLTAIDYLLEDFSEQMKAGDSSKISDLINVFLKVIFNHIYESSHKLSINNYKEAVFDKNLNSNSKRFIAACFLRLLSQNYKCIDNDINLRISVVNLFDEVLSRDIYQDFGINLKQQTYEKIIKLKDLVSSEETEILRLIGSMNNLESLEKFRNDFFRKIKSQLVQLILYNFVPRKLVDTDLNQLLILVEKYKKSEGIRKIEAFELARDSIEKYILEVGENKTKYGQEYFTKLSKRLISLLQENFNKSPLSKPAFLYIEKSEKKYPFNIKSAKFNLSFRILNTGTGQAFDTNLKFIDLSDNIELQKTQYYLGNISLKNTIVEVLCEVKCPESIALFKVELSWNNFDKTENKQEFNLELEGQNSDIDWQSLVTEDPYSLEPVTTEDELVGRTDILNQLIATAKAKSVSSSYIWGQKRVGKTSIAKTLKTRLSKLNSCNYLVIYLEGGDYCHSEAYGTIENLGRKLCLKILQSDKRFSSLKIPDFKGALSPLNDFLESVITIAPDYRILFILDEFDELPIELYKRSSVGDTFFLTLRAISSKQNFGFLLVGGEKMELILSSQGVALNKFQPNRIDYFETYSSDFQELVRKPVAQWKIEFSDHALYDLYRKTGGNPYFTKQICKELFKLIVSRRDSHVTPKEIEEATKIILNNVRSNSFIHFWEDGIFEIGQRAEEISINRKKTLLILAETYRKSLEPKIENIIEQAIIYRLSEDILIREIREFERRQILIKENEIYTCKVPLFMEWLKEKGINEIITDFADTDAVLASKKKEEQAYIRSEEIVKLIENWDNYKGKKITEDKVRAWLNQFGENSIQRLMFNILQKLKFYSEDCIREKMKISHGIVNRGLIRFYEGRQRSRRDIIVSYLDFPGKSGSRYAKLYADENEIYYANVIERSKLDKVFKNKQGIQAIVFIDDFIGTGNSACEYFSSLADECGDVLRNDELRIFFIAISGFQDAQELVNNKLCELELDNVQVHICDPLDESAKVFSDKSNTFSDPLKREYVRTLACEYGAKLERKNPLGYGDCQTAIVFSDTCPNNSLPILWSDSNHWIPLFKRQ